MTEHGPWAQEEDAEVNQAIEMAWLNEMISSAQASIRIGLRNGYEVGLVAGFPMWFPAGVVE